MAHIRSDEGKHILVEVYTGGKYALREGYLCIRCDQRFKVDWNDTPPSLDGCPMGHALPDRSVLRRQPDRLPFSTDHAFQPQAGDLLLMAQALPLPGCLMGVNIDEGGVREFAPVVYRASTRPGFLVVTQDQVDEAIRCLRVDGFDLPNNRLAVQGVRDLADWSQLPELGKRCEHKILGVWTGLELTPTGIRYQYFEFPRPSHYDL